MLGELWIDDAIKANKGGYGAFLARLLKQLAELLDAEKLQLDHDPALGARTKIMRHGEIVGYKPDANDPEFLIYREARAHFIKTNVRGECGQHPDRVLIKKQRRLERGTRTKGRKLHSANRWPPAGSRKIQNGKKL